MKNINDILINELEFTHSALKEEYANNLSISVNEFRIGCAIYSKQFKEILQMHLDQLDLSNLDFYNKYGFNVSEVIEKTRKALQND